jgi:hypothetical protein
MIRLNPPVVILPMPERRAAGKGTYGAPRDDAGQHDDVDETPGAVTFASSTYYRAALVSSSKEISLGRESAGPWSRREFSRSSRGGICITARAGGD